MERVAELVRLGRLLALPSPTLAIDAMPTERVAPKAGEQLVEHVLADLACTPGRQLEPLPVAGQVAGLLETPRQVIEGVEVTDGVVAHQVAHLVPVDRGEVARRFHVHQRVLEPFHRLQPGDLRQRAIERERLVATEADPVAEPAGEEQIEVRRQLGQVDQQPVVTEQRVHHRLELGSLLRAEGAHQRLHRRHALGELVDDVVEGAGAWEELPVLREELARIGVLAADPLPDQLVEVAHHLAVRGEVLGRHRADRIAHPRRELVEHLLAQSFDQVVEPLPRSGLHEVVLAEVADPVTEVGRQRIEPIEPPGRQVLRDARRVLVRGVGARPFEPAFHARPLLGDDLLELTPDVAQHVAQVVAVAQLLATTGQPLHQVLQAGHVRSGLVAAAPATLHEAAQGLGEIALRHHVVGQGPQDLVGIEVGQVLAAVPARVASATNQVAERAVGWRNAAAEVARIGRVGRHAAGSGARRHRW